jgi:hypothetical protein
MPSGSLCPSLRSAANESLIFPGVIETEEHMEYAVKAETNEGHVVILRRGFASTEDAEDHRIKLSLWKRVWVEQIEMRARDHIRG